jgi:hypothetical protein
MNDRMNEVTVFSPFGGQLILEEVLGSNNEFKIPENSISTKKGSDRSMFSYVPLSGCYDAKQEQVLMVLRDENDEVSAVKLMKELKLDELAEEKHLILLFPNPSDQGWNYQGDVLREDDLSFLVRCFAALPKSKGKASGFNGMIFNIATSNSSSALLSLLSERQPVDCSAMMLGAYPKDYHIAQGGLRQSVNAWVYEENKELQEYLIEVNHIGSKSVSDGLSKYTSKLNENNMHFVSNTGLNANQIKNAWELLFSETRRWRNDTYGTYQKRTNFTEWGFVGHVNDDSLSVNNGFKHTWYEYVPEQLRGTKEKVPLVFYFHGGACVPLYGAEQSDWHEIAKKENFIVVYPKASIGKMWNAFDDLNQPSDFAFVLALIEHMKKVHPIDETRIYLSGFSMGSMMSNAMACAYPQLFAATAPLNAQHLGYLSNRAKLMSSPALGNKPTDDLLNEISHTKILADEAKKRMDYRMPVFQCSGLLDDLFNTWPIDKEENLWIPSFNYWKAYNHIPVTKFEYNSKYETGLYSDETRYVCVDERFIHHTWYTSDTHLPLYQFLVAKRMPHAVDLREIRLAWQFMKHFSRNSDGTLEYKE